MTSDRLVAGPEGIWKYKLWRACRPGAHILMFEKRLSA